MLLTKVMNYSEPIIHIRPACFFSECYRLSGKLSNCFQPVNYCKGSVYYLFSFVLIQKKQKIKKKISYLPAALWNNTSRAILHLFHKAISSARPDFFRATAFLILFQHENAIFLSNISLMII